MTASSPPSDDGSDDRSDGPHPTASAGSDGPPGPDVADPSLADAVDRVAASVVGLPTHGGLAAAFAWRDGWLVTSAAILGRRREPATVRQVVLPGGELAEARLQGADPGTDLALFALNGASLPAPRRFVGAARVGDLVFAVGREDGGRVHASFGHVGSVGGAWRSWRGGRIERYLRLDGGLYGGLVGAPVADGRGRVLGLASAALSRHHGLVLPFETIERVAEALVAHGHVPRGHLGVAVQPVRTRVDGQGVDGLLVSSIADDGPAARAGLLVGDVVLAVGAAGVAEPAALREKLEGLPSGSVAPLAVVRGGQRLQVDVTLGEPPGRACR